MSAIGVALHGFNHRGGSNRPWAHAFIAMGVPIGSMTLAELSEAIPPAYARFVVEAFLLEPPTQSRRSGGAQGHARGRDPHDGHRGPSRDGRDYLSETTGSFAAPVQSLRLSLLRMPLPGRQAGPIRLTGGREAAPNPFS